MAMTNQNSKRVGSDRGSHVTVYRKEPNGEWKAVADIATSELPPVGPSSPPTR
jgi:hypothetical protein